MKLNNNRFFISRINVVDKTSTNLTPKTLFSGFNGMLLRNRSNQLVSIIKLILGPAGGQITPRWVVNIKMVIRYLVRLQEHQGFVGTTKYLKVCSVALQQVIGNHIEKDLTSLGPRISRTRSGYPRILPSLWRKQIRNGSVLHIRMALTIFAIYRELIIPAKAKYSTITDGPRFDTSFMEKLLLLVKPFLRSWGVRISDSWFDLKRITIFPISKSSPTTLSMLNESSTSGRALLDTIWQWKFFFKDLLPDLRNYISLADKTFLDHFFFRLFDEVDKIKGVTVKRNLGKLGFKHEAAGKMRVFAMVDPITQWVLRPLHQFLFSLLAKRVTDGTFNQLQPLKRIPWGSVPIYSFDLSAATDRLPLLIQKELISGMFSPEFAQSWANLLVKRPYYNRLTKENLYYGTGQPMGALSSWAMLALTHHFLVYYSAYLCGKLPFSDYAVLGDDIVIWSKPVAAKYLEVMKNIGVEVGLAKSVLSPSGGSLEFAKRTLYKGVDVSPIPISEFRASLRSTSAAKEFMLKYSLSFQGLLKAFGYGWRVVSRFSPDTIDSQNSRVKALYIAMQKPINELELLTSFLVGRQLSALSVEQLKSKLGYLDLDLGSSLVNQLLLYIAGELVKLIKDTTRIISLFEDKKDDLFFSLPSEAEEEHYNASPSYLSDSDLIKQWSLTLDIIVIESNSNAMTDLKDALKAFKLLQIRVNHMLDDYKYLSSVAVSMSGLSSFWIQSHLHQRSSIVGISVDQFLKLINDMLYHQNRVEILSLLVKDKPERPPIKINYGLTRKELSSIDRWFMIYSNQPK